MAKKSRRARLQDTDKKKQGSVTPSPLITDAPAASPPVASTAASLEAPSTSRKAIDFGQEYFYVYREVRNLFIVAVVMFVVLFGLAFVI